MPLVDFLLPMLDDHLRVVALGVGHVNAQLNYNPGLSFYLQADLARPLIVEQGVLLPGSTTLVSATTAVGPMCVPIILLPCVAACWPVRAWQEYLWRCLLLLPLLILLFALDVPIQLLGYVERFLAGENVAAHWVRWSVFLDHGGRVLLALLASYIVVVSAQSMTHQMQKRRSS